MRPPFPKTEYSKCSIFYHEDYAMPILVSPKIFYKNEKKGRIYAVFPSNFVDYHPGISIGEPPKPENWGPPYIEAMYECTMQYAFRPNAIIIEDYYKVINIKEIKKILDEKNETRLPFVY